jgi:hypothetical protein
MAEEQHTMTKKIQSKHLKTFRETKMKAKEEVSGSLKGWIGEMMGSGDDTQHHGEFILSNLRVCFYRKGLLGEVFETIPIPKITSVETLSRLGYRVLRIHTSHDSLAFKTFESKNEFEKVYNQLESLRETPVSEETETANFIYRDEIECPFCAEMILRKAKICKHCGADVTDTSGEDNSVVSSISIPEFAETTFSTTTSGHPNSSVIRTSCKCGAKIKAKSEYAGKKVKCPKCNDPLEIPSP